MSDRPTSSGLPLLLFALVLCAAGGGWLLSQTVAQDIRHPAYSTLNDTPRGTRLLFDALSRTPLRTRRLFEKEELPPDATLFRIGEPLSQPALSQLLRDPDQAAFVASGGRLVCAFAGWQPDASGTLSERRSSTGQCDVACACTTNLATEAARPTRGLALRALTNLTSRAAAGDGQLPWLSVATFEITGEATNRWHTRFALEGRPVMIETRFGKGSLVLSTDCYHLSNEALAADRNPGLLAALVGPSRTVLFDETVHGIQDHHNTAWLLKRYRLHLLVGALAALFLLTLWQHTCPLLPHQSGSGPEPLRGFRLEDGLVCLLRQHLDAAQLPRHLVALWEQSARQPDPALRDALRRAVEAAEHARTPPEETVRALYALASRNTRSRRPAGRPAQPLKGDTP